MHIAISSYPLTSAHKLRGIGVYTDELIKALKQYETKHSYTLFTRTTDIPDSCDLVHYPFFEPFFLTLPIRKHKPTVVTVHDLIPLVFPQHFPRGIKGELKWQIERWSLRGASRIIADSKCTKNDVARIVGFDEKKIAVVPLAPRQGFRPVTDPGKFIAVAKKYSLPDHFVLYVGDLNWNKNVTGLLHAWALLQQERVLPADTKLILVGRAFLDPDLSEATIIKNSVKALHIEDSVREVGYVSEEDLQAMYTYGALCIFPSYYEGFGLPVLEAMACGAVTVVSDTSSLSEIAGPALRIDPKASSSIADGIRKAFSFAPTKREAMIKESIAWASKFTWQNVARETVRTYEKVVG